MVERLLDAAARQRGEDPLALRRRNAIAAFPYTAALGSVIDCGRYAGNIEDLAALADQVGFTTAAPPARRAACGAGWASAASWKPAAAPSTNGPGCGSSADGRVALMLRHAEQRPGPPTSFPQVAADLLGLPPERFAPGAGRYRAHPLRQRPWRRPQPAPGRLRPGPRRRGAAGQGPPVAARLLQAAPEALRFAAGAFHLGAQAVTLDEVAAAMPEGAGGRSHRTLRPHHLPLRRPAGRGGAGPRDGRGDALPLPGGR
jgi:carbon-monoxide dehydrogenase large subunit